MTSDAVAEALMAAEQRDEVLALGALGRPQEVGPATVMLAETALAPLAARAVAAAVDAEPSVWVKVAVDYTTHLGEQTSYLALAESLDELLDSPATARHVGAAIHATMLNEHERRVLEQPDLAAARLQGALRTALVGAVTPYLVLHQLSVVPSSAPDPYVAALPRLIGIALDRWDSDETLTAPLLISLERLRENDASAAAAVFEVGCSQLRSALRAEGSDALVHLHAAQEFFAEAMAIDADRDDAAAYAAVCQAVLAFSAGDASALVVATELAEEAIQQRITWHLGAHLPSWRTPVLGAEVQWLGLVLDLRQAMARLRERSWLHVSAALGQLTRVYSAERATQPASGLAGVLRPAIENRLTENAVLVDQLARAIEQDRSSESPQLPAGADALHTAISQYSSSSPATEEKGAADAASAPDDVEARLHEAAELLRALPGGVVDLVARAATDEELRQIAAMLVPALTPGIETHPTLGSMRRRLLDGLQANPSFLAEAAAVVTALLEATLTFMLDRYDRGGPMLPGLKNILRPLAKGETPPEEKEFQGEFFVWLANSPQFAGRASLETPDVATGRVDVIVRVGDVRVVTEIKRELRDASRSAIEEQYVSQASAYAGSNVPFSQLLVLDLTDHSGGVPSLPDLAWVVEHRVSKEASPRHIVAGVVVGNRPTPSALS
jgi:hypothetical protein